MGQLNMESPCYGRGGLVEFRARRVFREFVMIVEKNSDKVETHACCWGEWGNTNQKVHTTSQLIRLLYGGIA